MLWSIYFLGPILLILIVVVIGCGAWVGRLEGWTFFDALYWSLITATTVGYGDIRPLRKKSRALAIVVALTGIVLTGFLVAIAVNAASVVVRDYVPQDLIERVRSKD